MVASLANAEAEIAKVEARMQLEQQDSEELLRVLTRSEGRVEELETERLNKDLEEARERILLEERLSDCQRDRERMEAIIAELHAAVDKEARELDESMEIREQQAAQIAELLGESTLGIPKTTTLMRKLEVAKGKFRLSQRVVTQLHDYLASAQASLERQKRGFDAVDPNLATRLQGVRSAVLEMHTVRENVEELYGSLTTKLAGLPADISCEVYVVNCRAILTAQADSAELLYNLTHVLLQAIDTVKTAAGQPSAPGTLSLPVPVPHDRNFCGF
jgi:chromosome segregation ATPase